MMMRQDKLDAMEALGLHQKVLDLIFTCDINEIMLLVPNSGPFLLDHCTIESLLNIQVTHNLYRRQAITFSRTWIWKKSIMRPN